MKVIRSVESNGRFTIPIEMRKRLDIADEQPIEITLIEETNQMILRKIQQNCALCGSTKSLTEISGKYICKNCIKTIKNT